MQKQAPRARADVTPDYEVARTAAALKPCQISVLLFMRPGRAYWEGDLLYYVAGLRKVEDLINLHYWYPARDLIHPLTNMGYHLYPKRGKRRSARWCWKWHLTTHGVAVRTLLKKQGWYLTEA